MASFNDQSIWTTYQYHGTGAGPNANKFVLGAAGFPYALYPTNYAPATFIMMIPVRTPTGWTSQLLQSNNAVAVLSGDTTTVAHKLDGAYTSMNPTFHSQHLAERAAAQIDRKPGKLPAILVAVENLVLFYLSLTTGKRAWIAAQAVTAIDVMDEHTVVIHINAGKNGEWLLTHHDPAIPAVVILTRWRLANAAQALLNAKHHRQQAG